MTYFYASRFESSEWNCAILTTLVYITPRQVQSTLSFQMIHVIGNSEAVCPRFTNPEPCRMISSGIAKNVFDDSQNQGDDRGDTYR
jgi:hypothetical protein